MGREWQEARDARAKELQRRQARGIYGQLPHQVFMVHAVKGPLIENASILISSDSSRQDQMKALIRLKRVASDFKKLPKPTINNTWHPNSHNLIEVRDEIERRHFGLRLSRIFSLAADFGIELYDYDPPYRDIMDDVYSELRRRPWNVASLIEVRQWFLDNCHLDAERVGFMRAVFDLMIKHERVQKIAKIAFEELNKKDWAPKGSQDIIRHDWPWWKVNPVEPGMSMIGGL